MKDEYEINASTFAVIALDDERSLIIEEDDEFVVENSAMKVIDDSCRYFGSSYDGRFEGTKNLTGFAYKSPIIIEESRNIIFFPTKSPRLTRCMWISLNNLSDYEKKNKRTKLIFANGYNLDVDVSYKVIENQISRAMRLDAILRKRKIQEK